MPNTTVKQFGEPTHVELTVPIDQSSNTASAEIVTNGGVIVRVVTPSGWNAGTLSFKERPSSVGTAVAVNDGTADYSLTTAASKAYMVPPNNLIGVSGNVTLVSSVAQTGLSLTLILRMIP